MVSQQLLDQVVEGLNRQRIRATYGAVAGVIGVLPIGVGAQLGRWNARHCVAEEARQPRLSWIVNQGTGQPVGYTDDQKHPELERTDEIVDTPERLRELLESASDEDPLAAIRRDISAVLGAIEDLDKKVERGFADLKVLFTEIILKESRQTRAGS